MRLALFSNIRRDIGLFLLRQLDFLHFGTIFPKGKVAVQRMLFQILFFILPGWALGALGATGAILFQPFETALLVCAGALAGTLLVRWALRKDKLPTLARMAFLLLLAPTQSFWAVLAAGIAVGSVISLPERLTGRFGKLLFGIFASGAALLGYFGGLYRLATMEFTVFLPLLALPGILTILTRFLKGPRWERAILIILMAGTLSLNCYYRAFFPISTSGQEATGQTGRYLIERKNPRKNDTFQLAIRNGRTYQFPDALDREQHAVLPAALEPNCREMSVLFIGEVPSRMPMLFSMLPWVKIVDQKIDVMLPDSTRADKSARLLRPNPFRYDLIFVSELPRQYSHTARSLLLKHILDTQLSLNGVLIYPRSETLPLPGMPRPLPGNAGYLMYQPTGLTVTTDLQELDQRLTALTMPDGELIPAGLLPTLFSLTPPHIEEPERPSIDWRPAIRVGALLISIGSVLYMTLRLLAGRYPAVTPCAMALESGASLGLLLGMATDMLETTSLISGFAVTALPILLLGALPSGTTSPGKLRRVLQFIFFALVIAGGYMSTAAELMPFALAAAILMTGFNAGNTAFGSTQIPLSLLHIVGIAGGILLTPVFPGIALPVVIGVLLIPQLLKI